MVDVHEIRHLLDVELTKVADPARRAALKAVLVTPQPLSLKWDYGKPGERYQCWLVGVSPNGKNRLVYCEKGLVPSDPWGFIDAADDRMGMDC